MTMAQDAYASALAERDELQAHPGGVRGQGRRPAHVLALGAADADLAELQRRATETLDREPADLVRGRALVAAYLAYLGSARERSPHARPDGGGPR